MRVQKENNNAQELGDCGHTSIKIFLNQEAF